MMCRGKMDFTNSYKMLCKSCFFVTLAACTVDPNGTAVTAPLTAMENDVSAQSLPPVFNEVGSKTVPNDIQSELELRKLEYDAVVQKAQMRGLAGGALQGGLLGILVTGGPEGAIAGGVAGGALGYWVSGKAATQIVEDHRNFLIRKWSIETVMQAAKTDTENTRFDLLLSNRALEAIRTEPLGPAAIGDEGVAYLSEFRERAEGRALVLHEVIPVFAEDPVASEQLSELLQKQVTMLSDMRKNVDEIAKSHD
jgi:hypothetical protein